MEVQDRIRRVRKRFDLSQSALAKLLSVSPSAVAQWERGERIPRPSHIDLLERVVTDLEMERKAVKA